MKYKIVLKKNDEGYSVSCPGLPGCWSQGETEQEAMEGVCDLIVKYKMRHDIKNMATKHKDQQN